MTSAALRALYTARLHDAAEAETMPKRQVALLAAAMYAVADLGPGVWIAWHCWPPPGKQDPLTLRRRNDGLNAPDGPWREPPP